MSNNFPANNIKNDLTKVFELGIESQNEYEPYNIIKIINSSTDCFCSDADEANWILIWENIDKKSIFYAYISQFYPVALVKDNCPKSVKTALEKNNIYIAEFDEPFSCEENILEKYVRGGQIIIDDRFLDDCNFSFDDERLFDIYECLEHNRKYITPYNFTFEEIR